MNLVRDVLDNQILARGNKKLGKVDGVILVLRTGRPPQVAAIEIGAVTLACRVHQRAGLWVAAIARRFGWERQAVRIRFEHVVDTGVDVMVDVDAGETGAYALERWLQENVVGRMPWCGR